MNHSFNIEIATHYGIEEAIVLENLYFWIEKNKANKKHLIDGQTWTYNSQEAFAQLFPYMNRSKIQRVMIKLEKEGLINKANYNEKKYDKTTWYALTPHGYSLFKMNNALFKMNNPSSQNEQPIPDINSDINPDKKITTKSVGFNSVIETFTQNVELQNTILDFIKMRKAIKATMTDNALKLLLNKLNKFATDDKTKIAILEQSIMNSWKGIFELKENVTISAKPIKRSQDFGSAY